MCAACGVASHLVEPEAVEVAQSPAPAAKFAALRNRDCRPYLFGAAMAMMADNIEHVITYWVLWQKFHSESLVGFQVISHWVPFLFLSVYFGGLADRFDCRRVIQAAQVAAQNNFLRPLLESTEAPRIPLALKMLDRFALLRAIPAYGIGIGVRPEHVHSPEQAPELERIAV